MAFERWSHVMVLERDVSTLRAPLFSASVHVPCLSDEQRSTVERLAGSGLAQIGYPRARLTDMGRRLAFSHPWYVGGGVAYFRHDSSLVSPIASHQ